MCNYLNSVHNISMQEPGRCGSQFGGQKCPIGCCSQFQWCGLGDAWCGSGCQAAYGQCASVCTSKQYAHACSCVHVDTVMYFDWYTRLRRKMEGADRITAQQDVPIPPAVPSLNGVATPMNGVELAVKVPTDYARGYVYK